MAVLMQELICPPPPLDIRWGLVVALGEFAIAAVQTATILVQIAGCLGGRSVAKSVIAVGFSMEILFRGRMI